MVKRALTDHVQQGIQGDWGMGKKYDLANFLPKRRKEVEKKSHFFLVVFLREKN